MKGRNSFFSVVSALVESMFFSIFTLVICVLFFPFYLIGGLWCSLVDAYYQITGRKPPWEG